MSPLQEWRREKRLTQSDLAQQCGLDRTILSLIETGQRPVPPTLAAFLEGIKPGLADAQNRHYSARKGRVTKSLQEAA